MQGAELKRTGVGRGRTPVYEDSFMVPLGTPALEFVVLDKEGGILKRNDDVVGGGVWNCAEATTRGGQPFQSN
jgi:hypothetical protein